MGYQKEKIKNKIVRDFYGKSKRLGRELTTVKDMLRKVKRRSFYPLISSLGVKMTVNTVNIIKSPLYFQSRRKTSPILKSMGGGFVNNKKTLRRGLGSQC